MSLTVKSVPSLVTAAVLVLCAAGAIVPLAIPVRAPHRTKVGSQGPGGAVSGAGIDKKTVTQHTPAAPGSSAGRVSGQAGGSSADQAFPRDVPSTISGVVQRFLEPHALGARLARVAASARSRSEHGQTGGAKVAATSRAYRPGRSGGSAPPSGAAAVRGTAAPGMADRSGATRSTAAAAPLPRAAALDRMATLFGQAFVTPGGPRAGMPGGGGLRARPDHDLLGEALDLLAVCFDGEERDALERQLLDWTAELEQLLAAADLNLDDLNAQGQAALDAAQGQLRARLQRQRDELVKTLRAAGKTVPDTSLDLDSVLSPEKLADTMQKLRDLAGSSR